MSALPLPESLTARLRACERRLLAMETLLAAAVAAGSCLAAFLALFLSDRLWETPPIGRLALLLAAVAGILAGLGFWGRRWLWRRRGPAELAMLVQRRHRALGDRLQGVLELSADRGGEQVSPALCAAAIRQVARECEQVDFREAVDRRRPGRLAVWCAVLAVPVIGLAWLIPTASRITWTRLLNPLAPTSRYTFARLAPLPPVRVVLHGEPFAVEASYDRESWWQPRRGQAWVDGQPPADGLFEHGLGRFELPGLTADGHLTVRAGDATARQRVEVVHRPALERLLATIEPPAYLQHPVREVAVESDLLRVPAGSRVTLTGEVSRTLAAATLSRGDAEPAVAMAVTRARFVSAPLAPSAERVLLDWTDTHGFTPRHPRHLLIEPAADEAPTASCPGLGRAVAILVDEALTVAIAARDDHGVRELGLTWEVRRRPEDEAIGARVDRQVLAGAATAAELEGSYEFSPATLGIPASTVVHLQATAADYQPGRETSRGPLHRLLVLSRAEHARLVRDQFEQVQAGLEEVIRSEEGLLAGKRDLAGQEDDRLAADPATGELRDQELGEQANRETLDRLRNKAMDLTREAMRNQDFPTETFAEWSKLMQAMQEVSQQEMPPMIGELQQASQAKQAPQQRREKLQEAIARQEKILEKLQETVAEMGEALESMAIRSFVARLREQATAEEGIRTVLQQQLSKVIGLSWESLPAASRAVLEAAAASQLGVRTEADGILTDLAGFNARTGVPKYLAVQEAMNQAGVPGRLGEPAEAITANRAAEAVQSTAWWARQFAAWADLLEELSKPSDGDGQGGEGDSIEMDMKMVLALLRLLQEEATIRSITRSLEREKQALDDYAGQARELATRQVRAFHRLGELEELIDARELEGFFTRVGMAMMDASVFLQEPRTDQEPLGAETEAIELLAALISQAGEQMKEQDSSMAAMMMKLMATIQGSGADSGAGGSNRGGTTSLPSPPVTGAGDRTPDAPRAGDRSSGSTPSRLPAEFREALESYFRGRDALEAAP